MRAGSEGRTEVKTKELGSTTVSVSSLSCEGGRKRKRESPSAKRWRREKEQGSEEAGSK